LIAATAQRRPNFVVAVLRAVILQIAACDNGIRLLWRLQQTQEADGGSVKLYPRVIALVISTLFDVTAVGQPPDQTPSISIGIVLDTSGSMGLKLARARQLISELLKLTGPLDEFALIQASDRPVVANGYGSAADALQAQVAFMQSKGRSAILDGIYMGLQVSKAGRNVRKILLVISDGGENSSRYTETEIKNAIAETGVRVYVVGVDEPIAGGGRSPQEVAGSALLSQIAKRSGGRYFGMERTTNLPQVALELISAMRAPL
jgi:Ca-activated chloride channel family protein